MTILELKETLDNRRRGLSYTMWKQAYLNGMAFSKKFPRTPEEASPELYPKQRPIKLPDVLKKGD